MRLFILLTMLLSLSFPFAEFEVVPFTECEDFFFEKQPPMINDTLNSHSLQDSYKTICQKYKGVYTFATLYDTANKIPVFSAFKYIGTTENLKRPKTCWMVEPQLDPVVEDMIVPYTNQAINEDFFGSNLSRGHLFASSYAPDNLTANSTFTLTNIVPQIERFNEGSWNRMENKAKVIMNKYCKDINNNVLAYGLTGAIPGDAKMKDKVNIPSFMWMAFCCFNSTGNTWLSQAYWAPNVGPKLGPKKITRKSLQELQEFMKKQWKKDVQLFNNDCEK